MDDRRGDWEQGVDEHLMGLTTAQKVTDKQLDDLELKYETIDRVLRGDAESDTDGFVSRLHHAENGIQELRAEFLKLRLADVEVKGFKWKFATEVTVKILALAGILFLGWDKVESLYKNLMSEKPGQLEQMIEKAKHPKPRHRHYIINNTEEPPEE